MLTMASQSVGKGDLSHNGGSCMHGGECRMRSDNVSSSSGSQGDQVTHTQPHP